MNRLDFNNMWWHSLERFIPPWCPRLSSIWFERVEVADITEKQLKLAESEYTELKLALNLNSDVSNQSDCSGSDENDESDSECLNTKLFIKVIMITPTQVFTMSALAIG